MYSSPQKLRETEWPCHYLDIDPENSRGCASNSTRAYSLAFIQLDPTEVLTPVQQDRRPESVLQRGLCFDITAPFNILMSWWLQGHMTKSTTFRHTRLETSEKLMLSNQHGKLMFLTQSLHCYSPLGSRWESYRLHRGFSSFQTVLGSSASISVQGSC